MANDQVRPRTRLGRQLWARIPDYAWAYRLRVSRIGRRTDPSTLREPQGPGEKRPILLLPGVYETWHFLGVIGRHLAGLGHPVHVVPAFGRNVGSIAEMAALASDHLVEQDLTNVAIVAHSKGGLIGKTLMISPVGEARVSSMVAITTPFGGSDYAHLVPLPTLREFVPTHDTIVNLAASAEANSRITSIYSVWDPIIPNGSVLAGATNLELPVVGHFRILDRPDLLDAVTRAVSNA